MQNRRDALAAIGIGSLGLLSLPIASPVLARSSYTITMLNADPDDPSQRMIFSPDLLKVPAGSQITFSVGAGAHNTQSTPGMIPSGTQGWRFGIRETGSVTLTKPGFYGYHCMPHRTMGMVGLIIVEGPGMMDNLTSAKEVSQPGKAAGAWQTLWRRAESLV